MRACDPDTKGLKIEKAARFCGTAIDHLNIRLLWLLLEAKSKPGLQRPTRKLKQTLSSCQFVPWRLRRSTAR